MGYRHVESSKIAAYAVQRTSELNGVGRIGDATTASGAPGTAY